MNAGVDASPLVYEPRRGVARAVRGWSRALRSAARPEDGLRWFLPGDAPFDQALAGTARGGTSTREAPRAYRRRLRSVLSRSPVDVFLSPVSAFPRLDVPVVATVHELPFVRQGPVEGVLRSLAHRRWLARDVRSCSAIVVPSHATRDDLLTLHPDAAPRVHVVPHAFDPAPWERAARARTDEKPVRRVLLVGLTHRRKGLYVWEQARERLAGTGITWVLVGRPSDPGIRSRLAACADVEMVEEADDAALAARLGTASLLVYPSLSEGFGFPPLEAMAAGVAVVATTAGAIPEVCGDAARLVPPGDPEALASAISEVLSDPTGRERLVDAGRARCREFPVQRTGEALWAVLRGAASGGSR